MNYKETLEHIGDLNQLITLQESVLSGGFQDGVRAMQISNGGNLAVTVLPGRCMDLYQVRYKGKNMNYLSPAGIVAPAYYDSKGLGWLRNFFVGMITTCGLQHIGGPRVTADGEEIGLHGRIANAPAENVKYERGLNGDNPTLSVEGTMREARLFGESLTLKRRLDFEYENDSIVMTDTITNNGFGERQFMYALHINYGYPLLEEGTRLIFDSQRVEPRGEHAAKYVDTCMKIEAPDYPYEERCYFHDLKKDANNQVQYTIFNEKRNIGVNVQYDGCDLPYFCEWKMLGKGEYVMGLEPMNAYMDGPKIGEEGCEAPVLGIGESITYRVKLNFIDKL